MKKAHDLIETITKMENSDQNTDSLKTRSSKLGDICILLKTTSWKNNIMKESRDFEPLTPWQLGTWLEQAIFQVRCKEKEEAALPAVKDAAKAKTEALEIAEGLLLKTRESLKTATPLIQNIRSLDQKLAQQTKAISEISDECSKASAKIETEKQTLNKEKEKRRKCEQSLTSVIQYNKEHTY